MCPYLADTQQNHPSPPLLYFLSRPIRLLDLMVLLRLQSAILDLSIQFIDIGAPNPFRGQRT